MRRFYILLGLGIFILFSGLATGFALYYRLVVLVGLLLIVAFAWSYLSLRKVRLTYERTASRVQVGDVIETRVKLTNDGPFPVFGLEVRDLLELPGPASGRVLHVGPGQTKEVLLRGVATRRGIYSLKGPAVMSVDPFGIVRRVKRDSETFELVVYPAAELIPDFVASYVELTGDGGFRRTSYEMVGTVSSIREYHPGDSFKYVHWKSSARLGDLMVKQFDGGQEKRMWVLMDLDGKAQAGDGPESTEEYIVTVAASVVDRYIGLDWSVGLAGQGEQFHLLWPQQGPSAREQAMRLLASVRAQGEAPLTSALTTISQIVSSPPSTVILITSSLDPSWQSEVAGLRRFGNAAMVVLVDPASFGGKGETKPMVASLMAAGVPTFVVSKGKSIAKQLEAEAGVQEGLLARGRRNGA